MAIADIAMMQRRLPLRRQHAGTLPRLPVSGLVGMPEPMLMQRLLTLIAESVTKLGVDLPRIVPVKASEGEAVVQLHPAVGQIDSG